jgi:hypothetical protein
VSPSIRERVALAVAFLDAALRYWLTVFPRASRGVSHWQRRAAQIPDPTLRRLGIDSLRERSNIEGAAAFAAFAPRTHRAAVVRALVAFQAAYNYADLLSEQPHENAIANGHRLHEALPAALQATPDPNASQLDYYALHPQRDDGGYLRELVATARAALSTLPSFPAVAGSARSAAERIVTFQSLNVGTEQGDHVALAEWAREHTPAGSELEWWEVAAAAGSSLGVHVLIAAAAEDRLHREEVAALDRARSRLLPLDRSAALAARQPRRPQGGRQDRSAEPRLLLRLASAGGRPDADARRGVRRPSPDAAAGTQPSADPRRDGGQLPVQSRGEHARGQRHRPQRARRDRRARQTDAARLPAEASRQFGIGWPFESGRGKSGLDVGVARSREALPRRGRGSCACS